MSRPERAHATRAVLRRESADPDAGTEYCTLLYRRARSAAHGSVYSQFVAGSGTCERYESVIRPDRAIVNLYNYRLSVNGRRGV